MHSWLDSFAGSVFSSVNRALSLQPHIKGGAQHLARGIKNVTGRDASS